MSLLRLALMVLMGVMAGCATDKLPLANPVIPAATSSSDLRTGDSLTIAIIGVPDPSTNNVQIDEQGLVSLPYIGAIRAAGTTLAELTRRIRETYTEKKIYNSLEVSVSVTERYVYVGGEVARPGRIIWTPDLTAAKAIEAAGGFTLYAKEQKVSIVRGQAIYHLDINLARKNPAEDPRLEPGDSLQVPRSAF